MILNTHFIKFVSFSVNNKISIYMNHRVIRNHYEAYTSYQMSIIQSENKPTLRKFIISKNKSF